MKHGEELPSPVVSNMVLIDAQILVAQDLCEEISREVDLAVLAPQVTRLLKKEQHR